MSDKQANKSAGTAAERAEQIIEHQKRDGLMTEDEFRKQFIEENDEIDDEPENSHEVEDETPSEEPASDDTETDEETAEGAPSDDTEEEADDEEPVDDNADETEEAETLPDVDVEDLGLAKHVEEETDPLALPERVDDKEWRKWPKSAREYIRKVQDTAKAAKTAVENDRVFADYTRQRMEQVSKLNVSTEHMLAWDQALVRIQSGDKTIVNDLVAIAKNLGYQEPQAQIDPAGIVDQVDEVLGLTRAERQRVQEALAKVKAPAPAAPVQHRQAVQQVPQQAPARQAPPTPPTRTVRQMTAQLDARLEAAWGASYSKVRKEVERDVAAAVIARDLTPEQAGRLWVDTARQKVTAAKREAQQAKLKQKKMRDGGDSIGVSRARRASEKGPVRSEREFFSRYVQPD